MLITDTTAIVTGGASGLGAATARALASRGAHVFAVDLPDVVTKAPVVDGVTYAGADVTDAEAVRAAIDAAVRDCGGIDILVNNAGSGTWGPALEAELTDWHAMVDVNLNGVLNVTHAALPHLTRAAATHDRGVADLVTISSVAGRRVPRSTSNVYAATKHAVGAFSEALRQELTGQHVRAGLVEPGVVVTELTTSGREHAPDATNTTGYGVLQPSDIADAVVFMVTRPRHTAVNEILVRPTEQTV